MLLDKLVSKEEKKKQCILIELLIIEQLLSIKSQNKTEEKVVH